MSSKKGAKGKGKAAPSKTEAKPAATKADAKPAAGKSKAKGKGKQFRNHCKTNYKILI